MGLERGLYTEQNLPRYINATIPFEEINVLPQPRKTFRNIHELAESIAQEGLFHPLMVARFDTDLCVDYLKIVNDLWGTSFKQEGLIPAGPSSWYILIAGERRYRACKLLREVGCSSCQEDGTVEGCYERHIGFTEAEIRLSVNPDPLRVLNRQASENTHEAVPPYEESSFYDEYFRLKRKMDPRYPLARFARDVGRSPSAIREALKFATLPDQIQSFTRRGFIPYGIACEIARIHEETGSSSDELIGWATMAVARNYKVPEFRGIVRNYIKNQQSGQTMMELFSQEEEKQLKRLAIKQAALKEYVQSLWGRIAYDRRVRRLYEEGLLGIKDAPYSQASSLRLIKTFIQEIGSVMPFVEGKLSSNDLLTYREMLMAVEGVFTQASSDNLISQCENINFGF